MDLVELQIFKTVAEQGGVTKAAAALHRVQSNVTTRVKQLEERLGTKLFHRQGRKLVLSSEGKVLLDYAERMLRLSSEAQAALKGGGPHGLFKLGTLESTAATRLPPLLARYHRRYPAVRLELSTGTNGALVDRVLRGDIESRVILAFTTGCSYRRRLESWLGRSSIVAERIMEYGSYHAIAACVAAGSGIAVVPKSVLRTTGVEGQVALHPLPPKVANARTMLVWRRGHTSAPLAALREALR